MNLRKDGMKKTLLFLLTLYTFYLGRPANIWAVGGFDWNKNPNIPITTISDPKPTFSIDGIGFNFVNQVAWVIVSPESILPGKEKLEEYIRYAICASYIGDIKAGEIRLPIHYKILQWVKGDKGETYYPKDSGNDGLIYDCPDFKRKLTPGENVF